MIYLDNAATTFPKHETVYSAMDKVARTSCVNAGRGGYRLAREATAMIDDTRECLLRLLGVSSTRQVIFAPSATVALNQIIFGLEWTQLKNIYVTPFEHNAIMRPLHQICKIHNIDLKVLPFNKETWELDREEIERLFAIDNPDYIFMSHMSNVTGYIVPCEHIMYLAEKYNPIVVVDCAQTLGTIPIHEKILESDYLVFAGHKSLYGPMGIGGFVAKDANKLKPVVIGGTGTESLNLEMPDKGTARYEAASYNIQAIAGLQAAISWVANEGHNVHKHKKELTNMLVDKLKKFPEVQLYIPEDLERHCSIVSFNIEGYVPEDIGTILDEDFDIAVRTGYHCSPLVHNFIGSEDTFGTVRVSIGYFNTEKDIEKLVEAIEELIEG